MAWLFRLRLPRLRSLGFLLLMAALLRLCLMCLSFWNASVARADRAGAAGLYLLRGELLLEGDEGLIAQALGLSSSERQQIAESSETGMTIAFGTEQNFALENAGKRQRIRALSISVSDANRIGIVCTPNELVVFAGPIHSASRVVARADLRLRSGTAPWQLEYALLNTQGLLCSSTISLASSVLTLNPLPAQQAQARFAVLQKRYAEGAVLSARRLVVENIGESLLDRAQSQHSWTKILAAASAALALFIALLSFSVHWMRYQARLSIEISLGLETRIFCQRCALAHASGLALFLMLIAAFCWLLSKLLALPWPDTQLVIGVSFVVMLLTILSVIGQTLWLHKLIHRGRGVRLNERMPLARGLLLAAGIAIALAGALTLTSIQRHLAKRSSLDFGFEPQGLSTIEMWFPAFAQLSDTKRREAWNAINAATNRVLGVENPDQPTRSWISGAPWRFAGHSQVTQGQGAVALLVGAGANLMQVLQVRQRVGRNFTEADMQSGPVLIVKLRASKTLRHVRGFGEPIGEIKYFSVGNERIEYDRALFIRPFEPERFDAIELVIRGSISPQRHAALVEAIQAVVPIAGGGAGAVIGQPTALLDVYAQPLVFASALRQFGSLALLMCVVVVFMLMRVLAGLWVQDNARNLAL